MKRKKIIRVSIIFIVTAIVIGGGAGLYLFNKPHRDVQKTKTDYVLNAGELVNEYLDDALNANNKYLDETGKSKILAITGNVYSVSKDLNNQVVVVLKDEGEKAGVSCTFMAETNSHTNGLAEGQSITVKGVIRSGAGYDPDLDLYEDVIMEKCDILKM